MINIPSSLEINKNLKVCKSKRGGGNSTDIEPHQAQVFYLSNDYFIAFNFN